MVQHVMRFIWHHPSFLFPLLFIFVFGLFRIYLLPNDNHPTAVACLFVIANPHTKSFWCPSLLLVCVCRRYLFLYFEKLPLIIIFFF